MGGRDAYRGFEYQLQVSVWLLLEGVVDGGHAIVEPLGGEDLEILRQPNSECDTSEIATGLEVSTKAPGVAPATRYLVQIKARRTNHWSAGEIEGMLFGRGSNEPGVPRRRQWPISILMEDPSAAFLFVTDSIVSDEIATLAVDIWDFRCRGERGHEVKPRWPRRLKDSPAGVRARMGILHKHPWELVIHKTDALLARKFRVPHSRRAACRNDLVKRVRVAMLDEKHAKVTQEEIEKIARKHHGLPTGPYPWVEPLDFPDFRRHLEQHHVLLLVGEPGVGKTTAAERLIYEHQIRDEPFKIVEVGEPRDLPKHRRETEPVLLYVEDPFQDDQSSNQVHAWLTELERLCQAARSDLKLLITSRMSFARAHLADGKIGSRLRRHGMVLVEGRTPGAALLSQHLDNDKNLDPAVRSWIESHSSWITRKLIRARSYEKFVSSAADLPADKPSCKQLEQIVQGAKVEDLGKELEKTFSNSSDRELRGLAVVWLTLEAWPYSSDQEQRLKRFEEDLYELEAEVLGVAEKLREYGWLDCRREHWRMRSTYLEACLGVLKKKKNQPLVAKVVKHLLEARLRARDVETLRAISGAAVGRIDVGGAMTSKVCEFAVEVLRNAARTDVVGRDFTTALTLLAAHGREGEPIVELARALCQKNARESQADWGGWGWREWRRPEWAENAWDEVVHHPDTSAIVHAFVRGGCRASHVGSWQGTVQLVDFLYDLVDVSNEFDMWFGSIEECGDSVVDIVAFGAIRSKNACVEDVIGRAVEIRRSADEWERSQYPLDEDREMAFEWLADRWNELARPAEALVDAVLEVEARRGNHAWALTRSEPLVFERFAERIRVGGEENPEIIRQVFKVYPENLRARVIEALGRTEVLSEMVSELLPGVPSRDWPGLIDSLNMREASRKRVIQAAIDAFPALTPHERVALTHDVAPELSKDLRERLDSEERAALDALSSKVAVDRQAPITLIEKIADSGATAACAALVVLADARKPVDDRVKAWLELENVNQGIAALDAAALLPSATALRFGQQGLAHRRAGIRKRALELLKEHREESATEAILGAIHDPTPSVRISAAEALVGRRSLRVCEAIADLLDDSTDTSEAARYGASSDEDHEPEYGVAKAAEKARDALPEELKQTVDGIRASRRLKAEGARG